MLQFVVVLTAVIVMLSVTGMSIIENDPPVLSTTVPEVLEILSPLVVSSML